MRIRTDDSINPLRPVDWRLQQARNLRGTNHTGLLGLVDSTTYDLALFLKRRDACRTQRDRLRLRRRMPRQTGAFELYEHGDGSLRAGIEARLLAGQPVEQIAESVGVEPAVIDCFAEAFFDVADRLEARDFIVGAVLAATARRGDPNAARHALWKRVAYLSGLKALEQLMHGVSAAAGKLPLGGIAKGAATSLEVVAQLRAASAAESASAADLKQAAQLQQIAARAAEAYPDEGPELDPYQENIKAFLEGIPWAKYSHPPQNESELEARSVPEQLERLGYPLRAHELKLYEQTGILPAYKLLGGAEYPEKKKEQSK